jgi:hypothetical protein
VVIDKSILIEHPEKVTEEIQEESVAEQDVEMESQHGEHTEKAENMENEANVITSDNVIKIENNIEIKSDDNKADKPKPDSNPDNIEILI